MRTPSSTLDTAVSAAIFGWEAVVEELTKGLQAKNKGEQLGAHFFTNADTRSRELIIGFLNECDPDIPIICEEQKNPTEVPSDCWLADPWDATTIGYNGCPEWGVTTCRIKNGQPEAGAIILGDGTVITAKRGAGCTVHQEWVKLNHKKPMDKTIIGTDIGPWIDPNTIIPLSRKFCVRSIVSAVYGAYEILMGRTGAYYNMNVAKIWDAAAGCLAVQEAGGITCAPDGSPLKWNTLRQDWILAANQEMADEIIKVTSMSETQFLLLIGGSICARVGHSFKFVLPLQTRELSFEVKCGCSTCLEERWIKFTPDQWAHFKSDMAAGKIK